MLKHGRILPRIHHTGGPALPVDPIHAASGPLEDVTAEHWVPASAVGADYAPGLARLLPQGSVAGNFIRADQGGSVNCALAAMMTSGT